MTSWAEFAKQAPELAAFGKARLGSGVAYLGTLRADGSPRVHPVTPTIGEQLFLFTEPTSPKGKDLRRDARYTVYCSVELVAYLFRKRCNSCSTLWPAHRC